MLLFYYVRLQRAIDWYSTFFCLYFRYSSSLQNGSRHLNFFGAPLVTCLPEESLTKLDIHAAVNSVLAPFLRVKIKKESSSCDQGEVAIERVMGNGDACSSPENDFLSSSNDMELDSQFRGNYLHLWVMDERFQNSTLLENVSFTRAGRLVKLVLDWSQIEYEFYDPSYLKDLPEVFKSGFTAKKTRQESISLFSCLEAFLKEEPLGPDDMWSVMLYFGYVQFTFLSHYG